MATPPAAEPPMGEQPTGARGELAASDDHASRSEYNQRWSQIWDAGLEPGQLFDVGQPSVPLRDLIREERVPLRGKRAFVPGCGRGYDVIAFAQGGASAAVGLELSGTAIAAAEAHRDGLKLPAEVAAKARFVAGDFLTWSDGQFDVGYDYTFLCALHPSMRKDWADAWARHLAPGGRLVTMIYPVDPSMDANSGPPWPVTPQLYDSLLPAAGFEREVLEPVPPAASLGTRGGKEFFAIWRRI